MRFQSLTGCTVLFCLFWTVPAQARHLGTVGRVYPIVEPDALAEIRAAAARVDWQRVVGAKGTRDGLRNFRPKDLQPLPPAKADKTFRVDMTYTLDFDIPDPRGGILYPKGFTFNPLEYVTLHSVLVVIDGSDPRQVEWFTASAHAADFHTRLLLAGGDYAGLTQRLDRPVFYLGERVARRLHLAAVPSVIRQRGRQLEVQEVKILHE